MRGCFFCSPDKGRIFHETKHFYTILGLGAFVEGYSLLVSKDHTRSIYDLPSDLREEYFHEKKYLKELIFRNYGPSVIFEHGRVRSCTLEDEETHDDFCFHAHQHFTPVSIDITNEFQDTNSPFRKIHKGLSIFDIEETLLKQDMEYLFFENTSGIATVYTVEGKCPRQYLRYLVAKSIGKPHLSNWKKYPEWDKINSAKDVFLGFLSAKK
jgi:diadenosine tetraphosphate (Ap4A) HIT family hydrolase